MSVSTKFVRTQARRLWDVLQTSAPDSQSAYRYGFVLHARRESDGVHLGVLTPGGETLLLTGELVERLALCRCRLLDGTEVSVTPEPSAWSDPSGPVDELRLTFFRRHPGTDQMMSIGCTVRAEDLPQSPIVLVDRHPTGWPR